MTDLTPDEEDAVLKRLVEICNSPELQSRYNTPEWIWREVVASNRLAGTETVISIEGLKIIS